MSLSIILVGSLQSFESLCEEGRRSEVRQGSLPVTLKMWEVGTAGTAGFWKLQRAGWALQEDSSLDHLKFIQEYDNEQAFSH